MEYIVREQVYKFPYFFNGAHTAHSYSSRQGALGSRYVLQYYWPDFWYFEQQ